MKRHKPQRLAGSSPAIRSIRESIEQCARSEATLLITGETGTGKGLVARLVHESGPRSQRPFVHLDCAALSPTVIESELFGHERGAFTDAFSQRVGRLELAGDGTLFLDEIGDLDIRLQAKLLRVLEDREFERVGGTETLPLRARVIAATHRNILNEIRENRFRADLFYRLHVLNVTVPSLRERLEDLPVLVTALLENHPNSYPTVTQEAVNRLCTHSWPGNVRELGNVLERCVALLEVRSGSAIDEGTVAEALSGRIDRVLEVSERDAIAAELVATAGNVRRAARRLGVPRGTLRYRIQRYQLEYLLVRD